MKIFIKNVFYEILLHILYQYNIYLNITFKLIGTRRKQMQDISNLNKVLQNYYFLSAFNQSRDEYKSYYS